MSARQAEPLKLVLDTQIWLDWLVFDDPGIRRLRNAVHLGRAGIYIDAACDAELERVLAYDLGRRSWAMDEPIPPPQARSPALRSYYGEDRRNPLCRAYHGEERRIADPLTEQDEDREPPPN